MAKTKAKYTAFELNHVKSGYLNKSVHELADELSRPISFIRELVRLIKSGAKIPLAEDGTEGPAIAVPSSRPSVSPSASAQPPELSSENLVALRSSPEWPLLQQEFTQAELRYVQLKFVELMRQFKDDVLATEHTQILQAIKYEILMSRNMQVRRSLGMEVSKLEQRIESLLSSAGDDISMLGDDERQELSSLETQLYNARNSEQARTNEYTKLQERHESLTGKLKGNREQRIKQIESSKDTFLGIIRKLQQEDSQTKEGREVELVRLATDREQQRLMTLHKYDDDEMDYPILSADSVSQGEPK